MASSYEIEYFFKDNPHFIGCFASDNLPKNKLKLPCSLIINTDPQTKKGDHWLGVKLTQNKGYYFDSFGLGIVNQNIINFFKQYYTKVTVNNECIQHHSSEKCGLYCIAFINNVNSRISYEQFISQFDLVHLMNNDKIVLSLL